MNPIIITPPVPFSPPQFPDLIKTRTLHSRAKEFIRHYAILAVQEHGLTVLGGPLFNLEYPFFHLHSFFPFSQWSKPVLYLLWYLLDLYTIAMEFPLLRTLQKLEKCDEDHPALIFLQWFYPKTWWITKFQYMIANNTNAAVPRQHLWSVLLLQRKGMIISDHEIHYYPTVKDYFTFTLSLKGSIKLWPEEVIQQKRELERILAQENQIIPPSVWISPEDAAPWEQVEADFTEDLNFANILKFQQRQKYHLSHHRNTNYSTHHHHIPNMTYYARYRQAMDNLHQWPQLTVPTEPTQSQPVVPTEPTQSQPVVPTKLDQHQPNLDLSLFQDSQPYPTDTQIQEEASTSLIQTSSPGEDQDMVDPHSTPPEPSFNVWEQQLHKFLSHGYDTDESDQGDSF